YGRSLLIIVTPMVILQSVVAFVFMERHWNTVTRRLSAAVTQDIAAVIDVYRSYPQDADRTVIRRIAQQRLGLVIDFLPGSDLPPPGAKPFFSLLDQALSRQIRQQIGRPFWIDTVGRSSIVEIRIQLDDTVMRVFARRNAAYASNSHIFLLWMVGTSLVLLAVAILFLRNQIRPILTLADAAEAFGKGRVFGGSQDRRRASGPPDQRGVPRPAARHRAARRVPALSCQSGLQCGALRALDCDHRASRSSLADHHGGRRRPRHSGPHARGGVQAVSAARRRAQPGRRRHRARIGDRPRHRPLPWRRHFARRQP